MTLYLIEFLQMEILQRLSTNLQQTNVIFTLNWVIGFKVLFFTIEDYHVTLSKSCSYFFKRIQSSFLDTLGDFQCHLKHTFHGFKNYVSDANSQGFENFPGSTLFNFEAGFDFQDLLDKQWGTLLDTIEEVLDSFNVMAHKDTDESIDTVAERCKDLSEEAFDSSDRFLFGEEHDDTLLEWGYDWPWGNAQMR